MKEPDKDVTIFNPANLVTLSRIGILILLALTIRVNVYWIRVLCVSLVPLLFYLDSLDGYLARHLNCSTHLGGILDVAGDRIVENVLWILLAYVKIIPLWIPVIVIVRGFITDGFRSAAAAQGHSTFSMMKSKLGWWLVASPASRTSYAILKAVIFTIGISIWGFNLEHLFTLVLLFKILVAITLIQSLLRGTFTVRECAHLL